MGARVSETARSDGERTTREAVRLIINGRTRPDLIDVPPKANLRRHRHLDLLANALTASVSAATFRTLRVSMKVSCSSYCAPLGRVLSCPPLRSSPRMR